MQHEWIRVTVTHPYFSAAPLAMNWDDYKFFTAVAEAGSVRGAARLLGVHASTVSRRLEQFEQRLGTELFRRGQKGLELTRDGEEVVAQARRVAAEIDTIESRLRGHDQRMTTPLRLEAPDALLSAFLMEELASFAQVHSELSLALVPASSELDLSRQEIDVALRVTDAPPLDLVGQPLGRFAMACYCLGEPSEFVGWNRGGLLDDLIQSLKERDFADLPVRHTVGNVPAMLAAVQCGMGVAALPCALADPLPELRRVGGGPMLGPELWLLMHPHLRGAPRVALLNERLRRVFAERVDLLEGRVTIAE